MKDFSSKLKEYVCTNPFRRLDILNENIFTCCWAWNNFVVGKTSDLKNVLESDAINKVRQSVLNGSYSYCNKNECPHLIKLIRNGEISSSVFIKKEDVNENDLLNKDRKLELRPGIDYSCNLSCPSCRTSLIKLNKNEVKKINNEFSNIISEFGKYMASLHVSAVGDPFTSKTIMNFFMNFDKTLYPKLDEIVIYTNGNLFNKKNWNKIPNIHKYVRTIQISVDAANPETYKKVRRNGNWEELIKNIKFILTIPNIAFIGYTFVVQDTNYKEMKDFITLIEDLHESTNKSFEIYFVRIYNWDTFTEEEFKQKKIWDESHTEFKEFLTELKSIVKYRYDVTQMIDIINKYNL